MKKILAKLKSRKLWAAALGVGIGVALIFGVDAEAIEKVAGAVAAISSVITYIITEGKIDAAAIGDAANKTQSAIETMKGD